MPATAHRTTPASRYLMSVPQLSSEAALALADLLADLHRAYDDLPVEIQSSYRHTVAKLT